MMKKHLLLLAAGGALAAFHSAAAATNVASLYDNTLYCQNQASLGTCTLWLNQDGTYQVFFNRGVQKVVPQSAAGPFQYEGRTGDYSIKTAGDATEVCLKPDVSTKFDYQTEKAGEIYAGSGCYSLPSLSVGQSLVASEAGGKSYKFWLLEGR